MQIDCHSNKDNYYGFYMKNNLAVILVRNVGLHWMFPQTKITLGYLNQRNNNCDGSLTSCKARDEPCGIQLSGMFFE